MGYDSSTLMDAYSSDISFTTNTTNTTNTDNNNDYFTCSDLSTTDDSCFGEYDDRYSLDSRSSQPYDDLTDSSVYDGGDGGRSNNFTTFSTPDSSVRSSSVNLNKGSLNVIRKVPRNRGILKTSNANFQHQKSKENSGTNNNMPTLITPETLDKIRECELEDVLQYARDIVNPDPKASDRTYSVQPAKVVQGSFKHMLSVRELYSKTGAFKYRTIDVLRASTDEEVGISLRKGDGWEREEGIYVSRVSLGSVFDQYEVLRVGDEIVQVNRVDVKRMSAEDVIRLMHIPEKLSVTVKMLTPFSRKRVERSGIEELKKDRFLALNQNNNNSSGVSGGRLSKKNQQRIPKANSTTPHPPPVFNVNRSSDNFNKVAHLQIGESATNRRDKHKKNRSGNQRNRTRNDNNNDTEEVDETGEEEDSSQKTVKISPYRAMSGECATRTPSSSSSRQCLSPIRECSSSTSPSQGRRKQSYVRWFDEG